MDEERWIILLDKYLHPETRAAMNTDEWAELVEMALLKLNYCLVDANDICKMLKNVRVI